MEEPKQTRPARNNRSAAEELKRECEKLNELLPKAVYMGWKLTQHQGFWYFEGAIPGKISFQRNFQALDTDIFLATKPKCGTTWLKALVFAIANRHRCPDLEDHPLYKSNPHELVRFVELSHYAMSPFPDLSSLPSPRLFATHLPFQSIPDSVRNSNCPVIYMCRNPLDAFASSWHFFRAGKPEENHSLETAFEQFCRGVDVNGPFLDHVLGYWKASRERPDKVLFLMYEDVKQHPDMFTKRIADFLGCGFSSEEESEGKIEEISRLCSFESLRDMEVNKHGTIPASNVEKKLFFRKANVGDWVNLLTDEMVQKFDHIMKQKLEGSGLSFRTSSCSTLCS